MIVFLHPLFGFITALIIIAFSALFFYLRSRYKRSSERKWLTASIIALSMVIAGIGFEAYLAYDYHYATRHKALEYSLMLYSSSTGFDQVYVPVSESPDLQESLKVKSGTGTFTLVNTQHGFAMLVNFSGHIEIIGKVDTFDVIGEHALTMLQTTNGDRDGVEFWMQYLPHDSSSFSCSYSLWMEYDAPSVDEVYNSDGMLYQGWNVYWAEYWLMV